MKQMPIKKTTYECSHCGAEFPTVIQAEKHEEQHISPIIETHYRVNSKYPYMIRAVFEHGTVIDYYAAESGTPGYNPALDVVI